MVLVRIGWALAAASIVVLLPRGAGAQLLSPGPLHETHEKWDGDDQCAECHESGKQVARKLCLACHTDLKQRIDARLGLHGATYAGKKCETCHVDHLGRSSRLIRWPGNKRERFKHNEAGWLLRDSHAKPTCGDCHKIKNFRGNETFLGLTKKCGSCHDDPHKGRLGAKCVSCHLETTWQDKTIDKFDHDLARFVLKAKHKDVECKECHGQPPKWEGIEFADCDNCHDDPHKGQFRGQTCKSCHSETGWDKLDSFRGKHPGLSLRNGHHDTKCEDCHDAGNAVAPSKGKTCVSCHPPVHQARFGENCKNCHGSIKWLGLAESVGRKNHSKTRYPLAGEHQRTDCVACHPTSVRADKRFRGIEFQRCDNCHQDAHQGAFTERDKGECGACHSVDGFWPTSFGVKEHATTSFSLDGRHVTTPCNRCHKAERPRVSLAIAKKACIDCHQNPHGDQFATELRQNGCATCHNTGGWERPNIDHSTWPLTGAHASASCDACHAPSAEDRKKGSGATYRGAPRACEGCHEDEHAGQFRLSEPTKGCEYCHTNLGFEIARFDHSGRAGYAITGEHRKVKCQGCHASEKLQSGARVVRYRLGYRDCKDCHANPHEQAQ